ncbi:MAG: tetratricopeptide repeat protein [Acidobacteriota bacterium]
MPRSNRHPMLVVATVLACVVLSHAHAEVPTPDLASLEPAAAEQLRAARGDVEELITMGNAVTPAGRADAWGRLAQLYHAYRLDDAALAAYGEAITARPDDVRWVFYRGRLLQTMGQLDAADQAYAAALALQADDAPTHFYRAEIALAQNALDLANEHLDKAAAIDPSIPALAALRGEIALAAERWQEAVDHLEAALTAVPDASRLYHPLGLAYRGLGDLDRAREALAARGEVGLRPPDERLDALSGQRVGERVFTLRGRIAYDRERYDDAIEAFGRAVEAAPDSAGARVNLGTALAQTGSLDEAIDAYRAAITLDPESHIAHSNLGRLLVDDPVIAETHLRAALALVDDAEDHLALAKLLRRTNRPEEARAHAAQAVRLAPGSSPARLEEVRVLLALGRNSQALAAIEIAHGLAPTDARVGALLANLLAIYPDPDRRDGARAVELAEALVEAAATVEHVLVLSTALAEVGRCTEAADWRDKVATTYDNADDPRAAARMRQEAEALRTGPPCRPGIDG